MAHPYALCRDRAEGAATTAGAATSWHTAGPAGQITAQLERLKWFCWHGNVFRALQTIDDILFDLDITEPSPEQARLLKAVREFDSYIRANAERIPNYGERQRAGEAISTAFTESAVNQVISKRMVKKQQMRWTLRGAHLLLQVRTRVLNAQLADDFHRWYPGLSRTLDPVTLAAQPPPLCPALLEVQHQVMVGLHDAPLVTGRAFRVEAMINPWETAIGRAEADKAEGIVAAGQRASRAEAQAQEAIGQEQAAAEARGRVAGDTRDQALAQAAWGFYRES